MFDRYNTIDEGDAREAIIQLQKFISSGSSINVSKRKSNKVN